ncbi:MAG TPA: metal-dependent hydrolase [Candidatus Thermoplasmatota archaeon]|nr:metal-dependent hydrolase [Candidatus Thermoplasmatota archaeon]
MDIVTHFLVPYASALAAFGWWRRGRAEDSKKAALALVVGLAGFAPDLDGGISWLSKQFDSLYWLQHRGLSHTLIGAPLFALFLVGVGALVAKRWPHRFPLLQWRAAFVPAAILGSWTHLLLDIITYGGVPLLWPFSFERVLYPAFFWLVFWLLPLGAIALALHAWGKLSRRGMVAVGALFVVLLVSLAGWRLSTRPTGEPEGAMVLPRSELGEWTVLRPLGNGTWEAHSYREGERSLFTYFPTQVPPGAAEAVARTMDTDAYRGFLMGSFGPVATLAEPAAGGGWNVTFTDVAQRFEALHGEGWTPTMPREAWGYQAFRVHEDGRIDVLHRGW